MIKIEIILIILCVSCIGLALAYKPIDKTTEAMVFTGGPGFPPIDITTITMTFTGQ